MELQTLLPAALPSRREENKPVGPTLLVGLGGTGKEILLRFRRLVVERYGSLAALPFLQFTHIDTDGSQAAREQYDLKASDDPLAAEVNFSPSERIDLTIDGGTGRYLTHVDNYPQIKRWFATNGKIAKLGNLGDGAGQIRMASRLGLYHPPNVNKIAGRLATCRERLADTSIPQRSAGLGFDFNPKGTSVYVIASLAGGTGGGTFLDIAFLLRRYFPSADIIGILLLPGFFADYVGGERVRANGYAALMELNHYSFGHTFLANWEGLKPQELPPPPFTNTYLIDSCNESNLTIGSSGKEYGIYRMVAEVLFQDYSVGEFAGIKRATRINLVNFNLQVYTHDVLNSALAGGDDHRKKVVGDTYPTRFGSFGLATISFPTDRVQNACAARLAIRVLELWQKSLVDDPLDRLFTKFLVHDDVQLAQGRYERRDGGGVIERQDVEDALLVYDAGGGRTFKNYLWQKAQSVRTEVEQAPAGEKAEVLASYRAQLEQFLAREDSDNPDEWGVGVRQIEANMRAYLERVRRGIEKRAGELANDRRLGVAYTVSLLRELKALLRNENYPYLLHFEAQIPVWVEEVQTFSHELDQLQMDVARHERHVLFRTENLKRDMERLVADEGSEDPGVLYSYLYSRVMKQVMKRGKQVCEEIDRFLGKDDPTGKGLLGRYHGLLDGFKRLRERLEAKQRYFSQPDPSTLTISLLRDGDDERWYRTWVGEPQQEEEVLRKVGNQLLQTVFRVDDVTAALAHVQRTPAEETEAKILAACKSYLAQHDEQPSALDLLLDADRFGTKEREQMVQQAYNLAKVWLAPAQLGLDHTGIRPVTPDQRPCMIGVDTSDRPRLTELQEIVNTIQASGDSPPSFLSIGSGNRNTIIFYNELAGVPAFYPRSVTDANGLHRAYLGYAEKDELHIDRNRFQFGDLIPKTPEEAQRYVNSLRAFVLGWLLGLLKVREVRDGSPQAAFHYSYVRESGLQPEEVFLGDAQHAVDYLFRDPRSEERTDRQQLLLQIEEILQLLQSKTQLWIYVLLLDLFQKKVYPPSTGGLKGVADLVIVQYSPEHAVLEVARKQVEQMLPAAERQQLRKALEAGRKKEPGAELTYEEFEAALAPCTKRAGKFPEPVVRATGIERVDYRDILVLDRAKVEGRREEPAAPPARRAEREQTAPRVERPCPQCGKAIDARALYCVRCKSHLGKHVTCRHCGEDKVSEDLELCWKCGSRMREAERSECPQCYGFKGYEEEFPCPQCGYDPVVGMIPVASTDDAEGIGHVVSDVSAGGAAGNGNGAASPSAGAAANPPTAAGAATATDATVECPTCYSTVTVPAGARCPECDGLLEMS